MGSYPAFCYNSTELPAALPAQPQPGCSGGVFQHGVQAGGRACRSSMLQEVRRSGNEGRGRNGFICSSSLFLSLSFSLSYLSLCRSLSLLFVLVASINSFSLPPSKNPPAFPGMSLGRGNPPMEENRLQMEQFSAPFSCLFSSLFLPSHPSQ